MVQGLGLKAFVAEGLGLRAFSGLRFFEGHFSTQQSGQTSPWGGQAYRLR